MLAKDIITDDKTQTEMIKILFGEIERLENRNNTLESRVSELEKHVFTF